MPGFVNCHSHVEYSTFRGILDDAEFGDWILSLVDVKASLTPDEYLLSARLGAVEAISSGITTIADTSYSGVTLPAVAEAGLRGRLYLEVFGVDDTRLDETMADVERRLAEATAAAPPRFDVGLAPHAPYTVSSRLYKAVAAYARANGLKVLSHVAESREESTYVRSGSGKFAHDYREKMGWERMLVQPYGVSPIKYLQQWDVFDRDFLAVHCVQVTRDDIRILKARDVAVAHCPKSNAKLGCGIAPLADLLHEGVRVGLGTDSPASSNIMDMFDEMRTMLFLHRANERDVARAGRTDVCAHRDAGRRRGARARGVRRQPRARQARRLHRRRRVAITFRAGRRPVLRARVRRQPGRRDPHGRGRRGRCTATVPTPASTPPPSAATPRRCGRSCGTACTPAPSASGPPNPAGGTPPPPLERRASKCCSTVAR